MYLRGVRHVSCAVPLVVVLALGCIPVNRSVRVYEDPFAGRTRAFELVLGDGPITALHATRTRATTKLEVTVTRPGASRASAPEGTVVAFRLGDQTLSLATDETASPLAGALPPRGASTEWRLSLPLSRPQAEQFTRALLRSVRVEIAGDAQQAPVSAEQARAMQNNMLDLLSGDSP